MKKKIIGSFAVLAIVALSAYNVYFNNEKEQLSALALANIEALASVEDLSGGESGGYSCTATVDCGGVMGGSMSCTGQKCIRGHDGWSYWVECDGRRSFC